MFVLQASIIAFFELKGTQIRLKALLDGGVYGGRQLLRISLNHLHATKIRSPLPCILLGDFNINLLEETSEKKAIARCLIQQRGYKQLIKQYTTDNHTLIDHIYTNVSHLVKTTGVLESYYSDHKPIYISLGAL